MAPRARLLAAALALLLPLLAGCGGDAPPPAPVPTSTDTRTVTLPGGAATRTGADAKPPFPAGSPEDVILLAAQRPDARVEYDETGPDGDGTVTVARRGDRAVVRRTGPDGATVTVGVDIQGGGIAFTCTGTDAPTCASGDPRKQGVAVLQDVAGVLGGDAIDAAFAPLASAPQDQVGVGQDDQAGLAVSCLAGSSAAGDLRLCVSERGVVTELTVGGRRLLATGVSSRVPDAELARPDAAGGPTSGGTTDGGGTDGGSSDGGAGTDAQTSA